MDNSSKTSHGTFNDDDGIAFDSVYRQYYSRLVNYADRIVHDRDGAESIVQDIFLNIWIQREKLAISTSLPAYLFKSVYNRAINSVEHRQLTDILKNERREFYFTTIVQIPDAEQLLSDGEINSAIDEAVAALPDRCRKIFILSKMRGYKNREIAQELNISEKTVEAQMSIALRRLREQLQWLLVVIFFAGQG